MVYYGCASLIQISSIITTSAAWILVFLAWLNDYKWLDELDHIKGIFTNEEIVLLTRSSVYMEPPFLLAFLGVDILIIIHTYLCFSRQEKRFHKSKISRMLIFVIGLSLIIISIYPLVLGLFYEQRIDEVESKDERTYTYVATTKDGRSYHQPAPSIFYYCRFGNGRPILWSKLKGIRMKKYGSAICQKAGFRYIASYLGICTGFIYFFIIKVLDSRRRDKNAEYVALLFDIFGDMEEAEAEAPNGDEKQGIRADLETYKRKLLANSFRNTKLPKKLESWLKTGKYDEEADSKLKRFEMIKPKTYNLSPFRHENEDVPMYLNEIAEMKERAKNRKVEISEYLNKKEKEYADWQDLIDSKIDLERKEAKLEWAKENVTRL